METFLLTYRITAARKCKIDAVVDMRCTSLAVLLESVQDKGNENAIVRTMDAFGFQNLHLINSRTVTSTSTAKRKPPERTDAGARKWITIHEWSNVEQCVAHLRSDGYKIGVARPGGGATILRHVNFDEKLVLAFGNEQIGISNALAELADFAFSIPMCGFVQSLNVSVAVAVSLFQAFIRRIDRYPDGGAITVEERDALTRHFYCQAVRDARSIQSP